MLAKRDTAEEAPFSNSLNQMRTEAEDQELTHMVLEADYQSP